MQVCTLLQTDNHASSPPLSFFHKPDTLPAAQPTASKHWRQSSCQWKNFENQLIFGKVMSKSVVSFFWLTVYYCASIALHGQKLTISSTIVKQGITGTCVHTHTHTFNGPFSGTTRVSRYQKGKPIWILLEQETVNSSGISWANMQVCTSLQTVNHASTPPLCFLQAGSLPASQPTASKHWRPKGIIGNNRKKEIHLFNYSHQFVTHHL